MQNSRPAWLAGAAAITLAAAPAMAAPTPDLAQLFRDGRILQDRNGDGVTDYATASIVLPPQPTAAELAAAANIAARLGFETSSLDLPLAGKAKGGVRILIGRAASADAGLSTGQGRVRLASSAVEVTGGDDAGLAAAAAFVTGWLPGPSSSTSPLSQLIDEAAGRAGVGAVLGEAQVSASGGTLTLRAVGRLRGGADTSDLKIALPGDWTIRLVSGSEEVVLKATGARAEAAAGRGKAEIDLARFYTNAGALSDTDGGVIPTQIGVSLSATPASGASLLDLAARLGLESAGLETPLAKPSDAFESATDAELARGKPVVALGSDHPLVARLAKAGRFNAPELAPGDGAVTLVDKAFGETPAILVTGDAAGAERAAEYLAKGAPFIGHRGKDRPQLGDLTDSFDQFVAGRSPAGQAAAADWELDQIVQALAGKPLQSVQVTLSLEKADPALAAFMLERVRQKFPGAKAAVTVENRDLDAAHPIAINGKTFGIDRPLPSEEADFWRLVDEKLIPAVKANPRGQIDIEARLSEAPEVRARLAADLRKRLSAAGADPARVRLVVLSAYKQGFSWLTEVIGPQLKDKPVDHIEIRFAELTPPKEWPQQTMLTPTRWLHEIYPVDAMFAKTLGLAEDKTTFVKAASDAPTYDVTAYDAAGKALLHETFDPKVVVRPLFDVFPDYEKVRVTTGWLSAKLNGRAVADDRVETDLERLWDIYQGEVLPTLQKHVLEMTDGKPQPTDAPFFGELRIGGAISEPDYRLGIGQEVVSALDGVSEDLLFFTRHFFTQLGLRTVGRGLSHSGRIIPEVRIAKPGQTQHITVTLTGFDAPRPRVSLIWTARDGSTGVERRDLIRQTLQPAKLTRITAKANGVDLGLTMPVDSERDDLAAISSRQRGANAVDSLRRSHTSADRVRRAVTLLDQMRAAGLYRDTLAYQGMDGVSVAFRSTRNDDVFQGVALSANGAPAPLPQLNAACPPHKRGQPLVQWDRPIGPKESEQILACMAKFRQAEVYRVGRTYLGRDIWAMDLTAPVDGAYVSRAKLTVSKPTLLMTARQHANEVSSTSHVMKLAEQLLTDPADARVLKTMNLAILPIYNVDGAQIVEDLSPISQNLMLHEGRFNALGEDIAWGNPADPSVAPEQNIRNKMWSWWLADIHVDPHGLASHEWVTPFGEYVGWPMSRANVVREIWIPRGWHIPGYSYLGGAKYAPNRAATFDLLGRIGRGMLADPDRKARIETARARYVKYATTYDPVSFPMTVSGGITAYSGTAYGARPSAARAANDEIGASPDMLIWSSSTEAADEVVYGQALHEVAGEGMAFDRAFVNYQLDNAEPARVTVTPTQAGVRLMMSRRRLKPAVNVPDVPPP